MYQKWPRKWKTRWSRVCGPYVALAFQAQCGCVRNFRGRLSWWRPGLKAPFWFFLRHPESWECGYNNHKGAILKVYAWLHPFRVCWRMVYFCSSHVIHVHPSHIPLNHYTIPFNHYTIPWNHYWCHSSLDGTCRSLAAGPGSQVESYPELPRTEWVGSPLVTAVVVVVVVVAMWV